MSFLNIEIKARCDNPHKIERILEKYDADFIGLDHQVDTYFNANYGRLKLREGNIENNLIHYFREDQEGPKSSQVLLYQSEPDSHLKEVLTEAIGILTVVDKQRNIYFIDNVKFHIDEVKCLGSFVEIEAIDKDGTLGKDKLEEQCNYFLNLLEIRASDLIKNSYSDILLNIEKC
jgi:predicted adenylyl cyclase CyaB